MNRIKCMYVSILIVDSLPENSCHVMMMMMSMMTICLDMFTFEQLSGADLFFSGGREKGGGKWGGGVYGPLTTRGVVGGRRAG